MLHLYLYYKHWHLPQVLYLHAEKQLFLAPLMVHSYVLKWVFLQISHIY